MNITKFNASKMEAICWKKLYGIFYFLGILFIYFRCSIMHMQLDYRNVG